MSPLRSPVSDRIELLKGTLDLLVLRTLVFGPMHGHGIAKAIQSQSDDLLLVEHGSLYPALHRLVRQAGCGRLGGHAEGPADEVLPADAGRTSPAGGRGVELAAAGARHRARPVTLGAEAVLTAARRSRCHAAG